MRSRLCTRARERAACSETGSERKPEKGQFISHKPGRKHKRGCLSVKETASQSSWSEVPPSSSYYCENVLIFTLVLTFAHTRERVSK